ncbi:MAG: filamentous hemagglutinin N-terminal domain-containing protein, partial [Sedimentisphaerales bacterium]|nr:filamentous hemagglutinin N-terminal domain-containing protein [Sedimentisphaerales bacterium]
MKRLKRLSKKYCFRQIIVCYLSAWLLFGPSISKADLNPAAGALPNGVISRNGADAPVVASGLMTINQTASEAIINWQNFDIGSAAGVQFTQPGAAAAVLNRIHDGSPTGIMGSLQANGRVFIVNPAGVLFGSSASVNVAQLVASSLDIADGDFMSGVYDFAVPGFGDVTNLGTINAAEGVALLGKRVLNSGSIVTQPGGFVAMAAGDRVLLGNPGSHIIVEMSSATGAAPGTGDVINSDTGEIESPGGEIVLAAGDMFALAGP